MTRLAVTVALLGLFCLPAVGGLWGTPLSLEEWEMLDPSYSMTLVVPRVNCAGADDDQTYPAVCSMGSPRDVRDFYAKPDRIGSVIDSAGNHWIVREILRPGETCTGAVLYRIELMRCTSSGDCSIIAQLSERCGSHTGLRDQLLMRGVWIDVANGHLFLSYISKGGDYPEGREIIRVNGLPTLFEVLQTYTPTANEVSFRVPYMPEGFQYADRFDTYVGDLSTVGDWSQAQPLQCSYPASPPSVGDYLSVPDSLPEPTPGNGYYYVTAVNYQGERRYGRKSLGGVLTGRDPAVLPACGQ